MTNNPEYDAQSYAEMITRNLWGGETDIACQPLLKAVQAGNRGYFTYKITPVIEAIIEERDGARKAALDTFGQATSDAVLLESIYQNLGGVVAIKDKGIKDQLEKRILEIRGMK